MFCVFSLCVIWKSLLFVHVCRAECCVRMHAPRMFFFTISPFLHVGFLFTCSLRVKISQLLAFFFFFLFISGFGFLFGAWKRDDASEGVYCWFNAFDLDRCRFSGTAFPPSLTALTLCAALSLLLTPVRATAVFWGGKVGDSGFWGQLFFTLVSGKFLLSCWVGILLLFSPCSLSGTVTAGEDKGRLLTHLGPLLGLSAVRSSPPSPSLHLPRQQPLEAQADGGGGGTFHFPKSERRRAVICQFGLNGEDSGLNVVFPPGCAIQTSRGGRGTQGAGCNARVKLELWWQLIVCDGWRWRGFLVKTPQVPSLSLSLSLSLSVLQPGADTPIRLCGPGLPSLSDL